MATCLSSAPGVSPTRYAKGLLESDALPLLLQHNTLLLDVAALCQLVKTSKEMRTAVLEHCNGQIDLKLDIKVPKHADGFVDWLESYGCLLQHLELQPKPGLTKCESVASGSVELPDYTEQRLLEALQRYREEHGALALKGFDISWPCKQVGALLQACSAGSLLHLSLGWDYIYERATIRGVDFARFTQLRSLSIKGLAGDEAVLLSKAVSALTSLTNLTLTGEFINQHISQLQQQLPGSLTDVTLFVSNPDTSNCNRYEPYPIQVNMQHLQALQSLSLWHIKESSCLPRQLRSLTYSGSCSSKILQLCTQLQSLTVNGCEALAAAIELSQLSTLTALTSMSLSCYLGETGAAVAAVSLQPLSFALQDLSINCGMDYHIQAATLHSIRWLTALTSLSIMFDMTLPGSPADFGAVLQRLTALQQLEVWTEPFCYMFDRARPPSAPIPSFEVDQAVDLLMDCLEDEDLADEVRLALQEAPRLRAAISRNGWHRRDLADSIEADNETVEELHQWYVRHMSDKLQETAQPQDVQPMMEAIAGLPLLKSLKVKGAGLHVKAVEPLTRLTQLTRLTMSGEVGCTPVTQLAAAQDAPPGADELSWQALCVHCAKCLNPMRSSLAGIPADAAPCSHASSCKCSRIYLHAC